MHTIHTHQSTPRRYKVELTCQVAFHFLLRGLSCLRILPAVWHPVQSWEAWSRGLTNPLEFLNHPLKPRKVAIDSVDHVCEGLFLGSLFYFFGLYICPYACFILVWLLYFCGEFWIQEGRISNFVLPLPQRLFWLFGGQWKFSIWQQGVWLVGKE